MIRSKIQIGDGGIVPLSEYGLVHVESDSRWGADHSDYESSKYPEEGIEHILPVLTEKPFDYKVTIGVLPPTDSRLAAAPQNLLRGTNEGAKGWRCFYSHSALKYTIGEHDSTDRDGAGARAMVIDRTLPDNVFPVGGYEGLLFDVDPSVIRKGRTYTLSMKIWSTNDPQVYFDVAVCNIDSSGRLTSWGGVRGLKSGLNEVSVLLTGIADGESGGTQSLYFSVLGAYRTWSSFEIWDMKLSLGDWGYMPYTPNVYDTIPTVGEVVSKFNALLYEERSGLRMMKRVAFYDAYKRAKIVGYPRPLSTGKNYFAAHNIAAGQWAEMEFVIRVDQPALCEWSTERQAAMNAGAMSTYTLIESDPTDETIYGAGEAEGA